MAVWVAPAIAAAGTVVAGLLQGVLQSKQAQEDREWQEEQAALKRRQQLENMQIGLPMQTADRQSQALARLAQTWGAGR